MGCASSKIESNNPVKNASSASSSEEGHATTKEEETEEKMSKLFDCASENHPSQAILDETRAKDVLYVYLQSFRLKEDESKKSPKDEDKGPPWLSEYKCELMMRKKTGGRGNKDTNNTSSTNSESIVVSETNDYRDEWISLGTKEFCCGVSGSLVPYLPRANSNEKNDTMRSIMKPMNCAPVWPIPGAVELSTAFRVKVFSKDMEEDIAAGDIDEAAKEGKKRDESEQGAAASATAATPTTKATNATVNALVEDAKKSFLEENGRASPDLIKKSMGESGDTEDAEEPMESLLVDPRLDEIFNENKKSDGSLGCVLFTLSTLLPPRNDRENAEKKTYEDNDTSSSTTAGTAGAAGTASPQPKTTTTTTTTTNDSPTMGGRRDSGELVVLDSKVCYFDVGYRGVVSTLAEAKFTDCFENQGVSLDSITCKHYCKEMKLDSKAIQAYTKGGFLSVLKLKKMLDPSLSPYASPSSTPRRLSLDVFRKSIDRERDK